MTLFEQCKQFLSDTNETDWYGDFSDGGYYMKVTKNGDESIEYEFNGATCYDVTKVNNYTIQFGIDVCTDENVIVWFRHVNGGHGSTHILDIDSFKWYIEKIL